MPLARARHLAFVVTLSVLAALLAVLGAGTASQAAESPQLVASDDETVPVTHTGDAMDDPAIWVHPTDPSQSLLMGNDKGGAFETYDLDGNLVQRLAFDSQFWGNVDVRQGVAVNGTTHELVGVVQRGVRFYDVNQATRMLSPVTEGGAPIGNNGEGFCLYQSPTTQKVYGISITIQGVVNQFELTDVDADGLLESTTVRTFSVGSEAEGCVADDENGALYISEENVALWRYSAEPGGGTTRTAVDVLESAGGHLINDIEGVTLVDQPDGQGFIIVSVQNAPNPNASYFVVYRRGGSNEYVKSFRVGNGTNSDDCDRTDGITATAADLGPAYPQGMFVCQDNNNDAPGTVGNQNLKMVRLESVNLDGGEEPPPPPAPDTSISFVGQATRNVNSRTFTVQVPATVRANDTLLLFASAGSDRVLTGPGAGWTQIGRVVDGSHATTTWERVAGASDAGSTVQLSSGGVYTKVGMTLAAYRGADPADPVASVTGAGEPGSTSSHRTPTAPNTTEGAWRLSYWSDKSGATTSWTPPGGETVRATTAGSGGGRVGTLLTDSGAGLTAGTPANTGGLLATANSSTSTATMWTILLRPAFTGPPPNQPPTASFTHECVELTCTFDGTGSTDPEDNLTAWSWEFSDEPGAEPVTDQVTEHTFPAEGTYTVTLTVADDDGASDEESKTITVGDPPPPPPSPVSFVGQATRNVNSTNFSVQVPAGVEPGDALLLFASQGGTTTLSGPGAGWTQIGRVVDGQVTTVWRKVATAGDAGSTVSLSSGTTYVKVALTLAAYRGTDTTDPVVSITGATEPGSGTAHTTPLAANDTDGAWRVSYWSDKNSATTSWNAPGGETTRATTIGSGGGRVSGLLTDSGAPLTAGAPASTGALTASTDAASSTATMWTILLRPES